MTYGFQAFDSAGNITIDVTDRLTRFHSDYTVSVQGNGGTTNLTITGYSSDQSWLIVCDNYWFTITSSYNGITVKNNYGSALSGYIQVYRV